MKHLSIKMNTPCEFVNITEINPLISHVNIKVCYVGEQPNRNDTIITKETALKMAQTLPGAPIVGFYNDEKGDFEEHNESIEITTDGIKFKEATRPYGFIDLNAKVWFQKYLDDNETEREYLCTEGYIWTGQYEEAQRIIDKGNNQSMKLDSKSVKGEWTNNYNFFIINEATISNLCILGEDVEPCFEGANISNYNLHFDDEFKNTLYSMINEIKDYLKGGKEQMLNEKEQQVVNLDPVENSAPTTSQEVVENPQDTPVDEYKEKEKEEKEEKKDEEETSKEEVEEDENKDDEEKDKKKKEYSLNEIPEYVALSEELETLKTSYATAEETINSLNEELKTLREFKAACDKKEKEIMIESFTMLTADQKKDVVDHIDEYSLDEIEAKLSVICVRNKVNFSLDEDKPSQETTYNLNNDDLRDTTPDWIKAIQRAAEND